MGGDALSATDKVLEGGIMQWCTWYLGSSELLTSQTNSHGFSRPSHVLLELQEFRGTRESPGFFTFHFTTVFSLRGSITPSTLSKLAHQHNKKGRKHVLYMMDGRTGLGRPWCGESVTVGCNIPSQAPTIKLLNPAPLAFNFLPPPHNDFAPLFQHAKSEVLALLDGSESLPLAHGVRKGGTFGAWMVGRKLKRREG